MDIPSAVREVQMGASLREIAADFRRELLKTFGFGPEETTPDTFRDEVQMFMRKLARHLGDRHSGEPRIGQALRDWCRHSDHYEAWDALLTSFQIEERESLVRRGKQMFPGPLTAHWAES